MSKYLFVIVITLFSCKEETKVQTRKFNIKELDVEMDIPKNWKFHFTTGLGDRYTDYHWKYIRTDSLGIIDIETKSNKYYTFVFPKQTLVVSTSQVIESLMKSMQSDTSYYNKLHILQKSSSSNDCFFVCRYSSGNNEAIIYSLTAIKREKNVTKIITIKTWDFLNENEQIKILNNLRNSLKM